MDLEHTLNQHLQQAELDSSGAFEVDWSNASRILGKPAQLQRPLLQFIQGLVALSDAGRRPCPGAALDLVYTHRQLTLKLSNAPHQPDWEQLQGNLGAVAMKESGRALGLLAGALLVLKHFKPVVLRFSGESGQVALAGPRQKGQAGSLTLCVEFSPESDSIQDELEQPDWRQRLQFCPLPLRIQGRLFGEQSWLFGDDDVEVLALAAPGEAGFGGSLLGHSVQHLGPFERSWMRPNRAGQGPAIRAVLPSSQADPLPHNTLPRMSASLSFSPFRPNLELLVIPIRFGVSVRPLRLEPEPENPNSVLVVPADDLPCDLNGELRDSPEVRAWFQQLKVLRQALIRRLVEKIQETSATSDDRKALKKGLAQFIQLVSRWADGWLSLTSDQRRQPVFSLLRDAMVQQLCQPVPAALDSQTYLLRWVGLLQKVGGRRLFACCSHKPQHLGRICLLLERPTRGQQHLPQELIQLLLAHRPTTLMALSVADLDGEGHPTSHRNLHGTSRFPLPGPGDWKPPTAFSEEGRLYLPALLVQFEAYWARLDHGHSEGYEITLASNPAERACLPEPSWSEDWAQQLVREGLSPEQMERALAQASESGLRRLDCLATLSGLSETQMLRALAVAHGLPFLEELPADISRLVPEHLCVKYALLPVDGDDHQLVLAMVDPTDVVAIDDVRLVTGVPQVQVALAPAAVIQAAQDRLWSDLSWPPGEFLNQVGARQQLMSWVASLESDLPYQARENESAGKQ